MSSIQQPATQPSRTWSLELILVIALPLAAVIASSTSAYLAYVKGFTAIPEPTAVVHHRKH
jgi:hypothetical protein